MRCGHASCGSCRTACGSDVCGCGETLQSWSKPRGEGTPAESLAALSYLSQHLRLPRPQRSFQSADMGDGGAAAPNAGPALP